jgi:uncharacterized membrane protein
MKMISKKKLAVVSAGIVFGAVLIAIALFTPWFQGGNHGQGQHMDMSSLTSTGWLIVIIGVVVIVLSLVYLVIPSRSKDEKTVVPLYPDVVVIDVKEQEVLGVESPREHQSPPMDEPAPTFEQMAIRLLEGDDRRVFRKIVEAGGEILQKDIVASVPFSKAKVSRIVDKLQRKGLVTKERFGFTNKIKLVKAQ